MNTLTPDQHDIAIKLAEGMRVKEIARSRGTSVSTVRTMLSAAYERLGVKNQAGLVSTVIAAGWADPVNELEDDRVTAGQRLYLDAFERWLRDPSPERHAERRFWLRDLYYEAGVEPWQVLGAPK